MNHRIPIACILAAFLLSAAVCVAEVEVVTDAGVGVRVSSAPNPAWPAKKLLDGGFGSAEGWLASTEGEKPWAEIVFPAPRTITGLIFYQASFSNAGPKRYARPKKLEVVFDDGGPWTVALHDLEGKPQVWKFLPASFTRVKITIDELYPEARYPENTGFQEIVFLENEQNAPPGAAEVKTWSPPREEPAAADVESVDSGAAEAALGKEEMELLRLLDEFRRKFEIYLKKKAALEKKNEE